MLSVVIFFTGDGEGVAARGSTNSNTDRDRNRSTESSMPSVPSVPYVPNEPPTAGVGRKTIEFSHRTAKQHKNRMKYLLKNMEKGPNQKWNQDTIADVIEYCKNTEIEEAGTIFFQQAIACITRDYDVATDMDIDTLVAILQSL
jgi:hypothetical protein